MGLKGSDMTGLGSQADTSATTHNVNRRNSGTQCEETALVHETQDGLDQRVQEMTEQRMVGG